MHDDTKHDHGNQHLDELDEAVAQRFHLKGDVRIGHAECNTSPSAMATWKKSDLSMFGTAFPTVGVSTNAVGRLRPMPLLRF